MEASKDTTKPTVFLTGTGANLDRYTAVKNPMGTPRIIAPKVPYILVRINGRIPNLGFSAVDAHSFPDRNSINPISLMAGNPEIIRYTVMTNTQAMVITPQSKKTPCIILSAVLLIAILP